MRINLWIIIAFIFFLKHHFHFQMNSHFQQLLAKASIVPPVMTHTTTSPTVPPASKLLSSMPLKYVQLSMAASSGLSKEASDSVPERIEGAIAPQSMVAIPGRLVKVHLEGADIRYISGMYAGRDIEHFKSLLEDHKCMQGWDRFGKGRSVV